MSVKKIWLNDKVIEVTGGGYEPVGSFLFAANPSAAESFKDDGLELLIQTATLCNTAKLVAPSAEQNYWNIIGDPTEGALLVLAKKAEFDFEKHRRTAVSKNVFHSNLSEKE